MHTAGLLVGIFLMLYNVASVLFGNPNRIGLGILALIGGYLIFYGLGY